MNGAVGDVAGGGWAGGARFAEARVQVRWNDGDPLGHINNAVYFSYTAMARMELVENALGQGAWWNCVAARVEIDYLREIPIAQREVVVRSAIVRIGNSSVRTREEALLEDGAVAARAEAVIVFRDRETGKSRPLSDEERAALAPYVLAEEPEV